MLKYLKDFIFYLLCSAVSFAQQAGETSTLAVEASAGKTYLWELYDVLPSDFATSVGNCPTDKAEIITPPTESEIDIAWKQTGIYYYKITISDGCTNNIKIGKVEITNIKNEDCKDLFHNMVIPNAMSANYDGANDVWEITDLRDYCLKCDKRNHLSIFNRWGVKVYEKENYMLDHFRFNGYSQNVRTIEKHQKLPTGTYFYIITLDDGSHKTGWLYIRTD